MTIAPNREDMIRRLSLDGFSPRQSQQLAWADFWEFGRDGRGTGGYSLSRRFYIACRDCKIGNDFASADSVRLFIHSHKGHITTFFSKK
jgi:hypothetical protein